MGDVFLFFQGIGMPFSHGVLQARNHTDAESFCIVYYPNITSFPDDGSEPVSYLMILHTCTISVFVCCRFINQLSTLPIGMGAERQFYQMSLDSMWWLQTEIARLLKRLTGLLYVVIFFQLWFLVYLTTHILFHSTGPWWERSATCDGARFTFGKQWNLPDNNPGGSFRWNFKKKFSGMGIYLLHL